MEEREGGCRVKYELFEAAISARRWSVVHRRAVPNTTLYLSQLRCLIV